MTNRLDSDPETVRPRKDDSPSDIFVRLEKRDIDYEQIKRIVQFERPEQTLRFAQWFRGKTIGEVLEHFDKWRTFLKNDFILSLSSEVKAQAEQFIFGTEWMVWQALIEANPRVGKWDLQYRFLPTGQDENRRYMFMHPTLQIEAVHRETKEVRTAQIPGGKSLSPADLPAAYRKAFDELGLWADMWKGNPSRMLISGHSRQGWPVFTRIIIPRLYEFMAPHYKSPGRYSAKIDGDAAEAKRPALYPNALLQDMLGILKMEHDWAFDEATLPQLKAVVQRHVAQKGRSGTSK